MKAKAVQRGRPAGATTSDPTIALAFGTTVRAIRIAGGLAQEALAHRAGIERSHMGKIERGQHMPTLAITFKIAKALEVSAAELMKGTAERLPPEYLSEVE
jgi:XRE family transcriptional regulator, regulator of sulfur utilization